MHIVDAEEKFTLHYANTMIANLPEETATLWSIKLPKGVQMADLASQPLEIDAEVQIGDKTYILQTMEGGHNVFVFGKSSGEHLGATEQTISEQLQLVEKVELPSVDLNKVCVPKPVVGRVDGLHQRWFPTGYGPEDYGLEGAKSKTVKKASKSTKKRAQEDVAEEPSAKKQKKDKKEKKDKKDKKSKKSKA